MGFSGFVGISEESREVYTAGCKASKRSFAGEVLS